MKNLTELEGRQVFSLARYDSSLHVDIWYPDRDGPELAVVVGLMDVRAANDISITYDFERDGWVIRMEVTRSLESCELGTDEVREVAFVPAWTRGEP